MDIKTAQELRDKGNSYRQIATALGVSKSTVANKLRMAKSPPDPLQTVTYRLPPGGGQIAVPNLQQHAGIFRGGKNFYVPSDLAVIENRENARRMWNNLTIREALQARLWAAAEQPGHVEPKDKKDKRQLQVATEIQDCIDTIPNFLKLKYVLLKSRFFGAYGVQLKYRWHNNKLRVLDWEPVHGDSIIFKQDSNDIAVYTTVGGGPGVRKVTSEAGYIGRAHVLEDGREIHFDDRGTPYQQIGENERQAFILMTYDPDPSDFLNARQAGGVKGLGIRSTLYPTWYAMQEVLGNLMDWLERVGTGITMYKFLRGNQASYDAAVQLAESQSNQAVVMVPIDPGENGGKPYEGVERIEPSAVGLDNMMRVLENYFGAQIRRFIVGQDSTSQPVNTGMGSKIAEVHENTFSRIVAFDCQDLAETLSSQLVSVLQEWNHPDDLDFGCRYLIDCDSPDVDVQMRAVRSAWEMGVSFDEAEVRGLCGMAAPDMDSVVVKKADEKAVAPQQDEQKPPEQAEAVSQEKPAEQADAPITNDLRQTVGGLSAIQQLQASVYAGGIPRSAAIANVKLLFGFTQAEAESLFPDVPAEKLADEGPGADQRASTE